MSHAPSSSPAYRKHTDRNLAVVTLYDAFTKKRRSYYLGDYDTPASREKYHRLIARWEAGGRRLPGEQAPDEPGNNAPSSVSVEAIILEYWRWVKSYHGPSEQGCIRTALRLLRETYGSSPAGQFGPAKLQLVRDAMIHGNANASPPRKPWARKSVNKQIHRITAMFKWAASREMLPASIYQGLKTLDPLKRGRTTAAEGDPVKPVSPEVVDATRPFLSDQINAMIDLQLLSGARGGELFRLRPGDIDRSRQIWAYTPAAHKTAWRGKTRTILFGPRAQQILAPFMLRPDETYLFSPVEAEKARRKEIRATRKTPLGYGNSPGTNVKEHPKREPGAHYTKDSYCKAIHRACVQAFPIPVELARHRVTGKRGGKSKRWETTEEWRKRLGSEKCQTLHQWLREHRWHPHQLRHTVATLIRRDFGLEAAQVTLGHSSAVVTDAVYAERDLAKVEDVMRKIG